MLSEAIAKFASAISRLIQSRNPGNIYCRSFSTGELLKVSGVYAVEESLYFYFSSDTTLDWLGPNRRKANATVDDTIPIGTPYNIAPPTPVKSP